MDELQRHVVTTTLRLSLQSENLDTFLKAQRFLKQKRVAVEILIDHAEEVQGIWERLRGLPPSPPQTPPPPPTDPGQCGHSRGPVTVPSCYRDVSR